MPDSTSKFVEDLAQIGKAVTNGGIEQATLNEARRRGNTLASENQVLQDLSNLTPFEFEQAYGTRVQRMVNRLNQGDVALGQYMKGATRDEGQMLADTIRDIGTGFNQAAGGIGVLGAGLVHPFLGTKANELLNDYIQYSRRNMSDYVQRNEQIEAIRAQLDEQDNAKRYEQEKEEDGPLVAGLKYIGRDVLSSVNRLAENPASLKSTVGQGVGSLFTAGPAGKALGTLGVTTRAAIPTAIGIIEAGGAYSGTVEDIMNRSHEELMKSSPDYRQMIEGGMDPDTAKQRIAHNAGIAAAAIQGPVAGLIGHFSGVSGFEAAPLASRALAEAPVNALREAAEEAAQSFTGQVSQNLATKLQADPEQSAIEGAGSQAVLGAVGGLGSAAAVQAPRASLQATAKAAGLAVDKTIGAIGRRADRIKAQNESESTVAPEKLAPVVAEAAEKAPLVAEGLRAIAAEQGASGPETDAYIARVQQAAVPQAEDFADLPEGLMNDFRSFVQEQNLGPVPNRFQALAYMAAVAENEENTPEERAAAGAFIIKQIEGNRKLFLEELPAFMENIPHDRPEFREFGAYADIITAIEQTPSIQRALKWAREQMQMPEKDLTRVDLNSQEGQEYINTTVNVATVAPQAVDPKAVEYILNQADEGTLALSPERRRVLRSSLSLFNAARTYSAANRVPELGLIENELQELQSELDATQDRDELMEFIGRQIEKEGGKKAHQLSILQHARDINDALAQGDMALARRRIARLGMFARSHRNKVAALNQSIQNGDGKNVPYQALSSTDQFYTNQKGVGVRVGNDGSERFARKVYAEALAIAQYANDFAREYPELGIREVQIPRLLLDNQESIIEDNAVENEDNKRGSSTTAEVTSSQATTSRTEDDQQLELPLGSRTEQSESSSESSVQTEDESSVETVDTPTVSEDAAVETAEVSEEPISGGEETAQESTAQERVEPEGIEPEESTGPILDEQAEQSLDDTETPVSLELTVAERFSQLAKVGDRNWFHESFRFPKTQTSRMLGLFEPLRDFYRMFNQPRLMVEFMGRQDYDITPSELDDFKDLLRVGHGALQHMKARLKNKVVSDKLLEKLEAGEDFVLRSRDLRVLNLLEKSENGYRYNPELVETAVIAGLDWALNAQNRVTPPTRNDVAQLLGIQEEEVRDEHIDAFKRGISLDVAKRSLADNIRKFWGLETNPEAKEDYSVGIPEALAAEILHGLANAEVEGHAFPLIELGIGDNAVKFPELSKKTFNRVYFDTRPKAVKEAVKRLYGVSELLSDMALIEKTTDGYSIGKPIEDVDRTQLRNPLVRNTRRQIRVQENAQKTPYYPNHVVYDFIEALGEEAFVSVMSGHPYKVGDLDKTHTEMNLNKQHWESIKGLQRSLASSFENVTKQMAQVRKHGEDTPTYYKHVINKLGRLQMAGLSNPQTDKLAREIFMPTRARLDLSNTENQDYLRFIKTVGQGIGEKTEKLSGNEIRQKVEARTMAEDGDLRPLVLELKAWLENRDRNDKSIPDSTIELLRNAGLSMHGLHSLISVARYELSKDRGEDLSSFETFNYLEADGKTNGPINALLLFTTGKITPKWLKTVAKGGIFFGRSGKTLNSHIQNEDPKDLYEEGSDGTEKGMADLEQVFSSFPDVHQHFATFKRLLAALNTDVVLDADGNLTIKRGLTKNPLTITIYGSGVEGIAGKVANELISVLYESLSQSIQTQTPVGELLYGKDGAKSFIEDLEALTSQTVGKAKGKYFLRGTRKQINGTASDFVLSPEQYKAFRDNVRTFLVNPMREAIGDVVTNHVEEVTSAIQEATQIQSIILKGLFTQRIAQRLAEMKSNPEAFDYRQGEFLSQKDLRTIWKDLLRYSPFIETDSQRYFLAGGETSNLLSYTEVDKNGKEKTVPFMVPGPDGQMVKVSMPESFSRSLSGDLSTPAFVYGPTQAGVSAIPTMTIGSGDGQMMLNALSSEELASRVLHVFDGLNMPADAIEEFSRRINEAVFKTWASKDNPVRAAANSFDAFMLSAPLEELFPDENLGLHQEEALKELNQTFYGSKNLEGKEIKTVQELKEHMLQLRASLERLADETDIRRQVYSEFPVSVDHMASGETPFVNEGSVELAPDVSLEDLAQAMNERYEALLEARLQKKSSETAVEQGDDSILEALDNTGTVDETGARVLTANELPVLFKALYPKMTRGQKDLMRQAIYLLRNSGYRMVFGNFSQLAEWEAIYNADRYLPNDDGFFGKTDPISKIILIPNHSAETIAHELIHAATFNKVHLYYTDPTQLSKEDRDAIERIEGLMGEFLALDVDGYNDATQNAYRMAQSAILRHQRKGQDAQAVNEFMAWTLSNLRLSSIAQKIKIRNPLFQVIGKALRAIKALIWGDENKGPEVGDDLLSNLRFNTQILMSMPTQMEKLKEDYSKVALYQSRAFGANDRLTALRGLINRKIVTWLKDEEGTLEGLRNRQMKENQLSKARRDAQDIAASFAHHFHDLNTMQAYSTFTALQTVLMTEMELNPLALSRVQELFDHTIGELRVSHFRENDNPDDPQDLYWAQNKFNVLQGIFTTRTDVAGRSSLVSAFLALAMTSDEFRRILANIRKPASEKDADGTLDTYLDNLGQAAIQSLSLKLGGEGQSSNVRDALDNLTFAMIENVGDQRSFIEQYSENGFSRFEEWVAGGIQKLSDTAIQKTRKVLKSNKPAPVRAVAGIANLMATMINEEAATEAALGIRSWLNRRDGWNTIGAFLNDVIGRTRENAPIYDMISKVREEVQQTRQNFRVEVPRKLKNSFKKPVSEEQWTSMFKALGKTDLAAIAARMGVRDALDMIANPQRLGAEIQALEQSIQALDPKRFNRIQSKAQQLARFMVTGDHGVKLLRNAEAIARLLGEQGMYVANPSPQLVEQIDRLTSLYAIQGTDPKALEQVSQLIQDDPEAMEFVTSYLMGQRVDELAKTRGNPIALLNHYKGHVPSEANQGGSLLIASDSEHAHLVSRGYTKIAPYTGSSADRSLGKRSYYYAPVSGLAPFSQGVLQTVHQTVSGVDPETGYTVGEVMAGRIEDPQLVRVIERQLQNQRQTSENLLPVYDDAGKIVAFERAADPIRLKSLNRSTNLADMIGVWRGRQVEELLAEKVNEKLIDNLYDIWKEGQKEGRTKEFVNIARLGSKADDDRVLQEAVKLIPNQAREYIKEKFGPDLFMVRRDMLLDTFGARQASVGDLFSGKTRWNPRVASEFEKIAVGILGNKAYPILVGAEKNIQELIGNVRQLIIVKSVIVPASNLISNMFQLLNRGVPLRHIIRGTQEKTVEINAYIKRRNREIDLEAELRAANGRNDFIAARKLETQIQALRDSYRRMSIWPLIEAGEFSAISNGQVTAEDLALADGKWSNFVEKKINELPDGLRTPIRYAFITRDTALYQGLARAVQYGDFVAKAILYDDLTKRKKVAKADAIATVNEAFVNYNRLAGRTRQYLESMGLLWFWNYKLRIMKEAAHMLRHNPLRSLLVVSVPPLPVIGNLGAPVTDNFLTVLNDGRLEYSIGPGMGLNSWTLNPWINLVR